MFCNQIRTLGHGEIMQFSILEHWMKITIVRKRSWCSRFKKCRSLVLSITFICTKLNGFRKLSHNLHLVLNLALGVKQAMPQSCTLGSFSVYKGNVTRWKSKSMVICFQISFPKLNSWNFDSKIIKSVVIILLNQLEIHFQKFQFWHFYLHFN